MKGKTLLTACLVMTLLTGTNVFLSMGIDSTQLVPAAYSQAADCPVPQKAYEQYLEAQRNGNYDEYTLYITDRLEQTALEKAPSKEELKKMFSFAAAVTPSNIEILDTQIDGDKATLKTTGINFQADKAAGTVNMIKEDGSWKVDKEEWVSKNPDGGSSSYRVGY